MKVVIVKCKDSRFKCNSKIEDININDYVIVEYEKFTRIGTILNIYEVENTTKCQCEIVRKATENEINKNKKKISYENKIIKAAKKLVKDLKLNMTIIDAFYTADNDRLIITYAADTRIDFRNLAKKLASLYKTRIELRQIGIRDKAKCVSGIGQCGRKICCSSFLSDLDSVTISMAKNQKLALNPSKINGLCGRLLCCLNYENKMYEKNKTGLPNVGDIIKDKNGNNIGTVNFVDILNRKYTYVDENNNKTQVVLNCEETCNGCKKKNGNK